MDFALTEEQREISLAARKYLDHEYPLERIAELADAGAAFVDAWPELVRQGWLDPDLGLIELVLLAVESGRALHPVPWLAATLASPVYQAAGVELPGPVTLADTATIRARRLDGIWSLDGATEMVDGSTAAEIVVPARTPAGVALFGVRPVDVGVSLVETEGIDPLRPMAVLALAGAPARLLVEAPADALLEAVRLRTVVLLASEAVGVAERVLEIAVEHAKTRTQFDRPIGLFQGVSHPLADAYAEVELARSLCYRAAADGGTEAVACAAHAGSRAAVLVCEAAIQVSGGMGVTWEFPLHRWYRRAMWLQAALTEHAPLRMVAGQLFP